MIEDDEGSQGSNNSEQAPEEGETVILSSS